MSFDATPADFGQRNQHFSAKPTLVPAIAYDEMMEAE
jgi:hypothetical protein